MGTCTTCHEYSATVDPVSKQCAWCRPQQESPERESIYADFIRQAMRAIGKPDAANPRHIEAYMRLEYASLDHLGLDGFKYETSVALECIEYDGTEKAERIARSLGL